MYICARQRPLQIGSAAHRSSDTMSRPKTRLVNQAGSTEYLPRHPHKPVQLLAGAGTVPSVFQQTANYHCPHTQPRRKSTIVLLVETTNAVEGTALPMVLWTVAQNTPWGGACPLGTHGPGHNTAAGRFDNLLRLALGAGHPATVGGDADHVTLLGGSKTAVTALVDTTYA